MECDSDGVYRSGSFKGRVIAVTGAGHGIGRATLCAAARLGATVVALDLDGGHLQQLQADLGEVGLNVLCLQGNVADSEFLQDAVDQITDRWNRLDGWVNNAFATYVQPLNAEYDLDQFSHVWQVNVRAPMEAAVLTTPLMRKSGGGSIVNLSSVLAHRARSHHMAYTSSKSALEGLTRSLAVDLAKDFIRVNTVIPGAVDTGRALRNAITAEDAENDPELRHLIEQQHELRLKASQPMPVVAQAEEAADVILFFLSDASRYVTGASLPVDGGFMVDGFARADPAQRQLFKELERLQGQIRDAQGAAHAAAGRPGTPIIRLANGSRP